MEHLPKPILGEITAFTIASPDLEKSFAFYQKLGFKEVFRADWPFPWIQITDGVLLIMLRKDPKPYIAVTYYVKDIKKVVADLDTKGLQFIERAKDKDMLKRYVMQSPDGLTISLINVMDGFKQPAGPGMLTMPQEDYFKPEKYVNKTCGLFGEFAHPVTDLGKSIEYWKLLGFNTVSKFTSPYPWAIISDGLSIVGLHQSKHFSYPAITFFAADMEDKIARLKKAGLKNYTEQGPGNIDVITPEGQHIFLFQLGGQPEVKERKLPALKQAVLETDRLLLKELNPEIMDQLFTSYPDSEIMQHLGISTAEQLETERGNYNKGLTTYRLSFKKFVLTDKKTGKPIGKCGFHTWYTQHRRAEIGYALSDDTAKGQGLMTEALEAVIKYGFEEMDLNRIEAFIGTGNTASLKLVRGLGFVEEGTLRSHYSKNGKMEDSICFSLLQKDYKKSRKPRKPVK